MNKSLDQLPPKPNLRPAEVARFLQCHIDTVYELIHLGKIPAKRLTRHYLIPRAEFLELWQNAGVDPEF
jgi:excisionase family DNA binding protein